jgi:hypothetical protein
VGASYHTPAQKSVNKPLFGWARWARLSKKPNPSQIFRASKKPLKNKAPLYLVQTSEAS